MAKLERLRILQLGCPSGRILSLWIADSFASRLAGLTGLERLDAERGMVMPGCRSVHTAGMKFAIDLLFVTGVTGATGAARVVAVRRDLVPWRLAGLRARGRRLSAIELAAGVASEAGIGPGVELAGVARI